MGRFNIWKRVKMKKHQTSVHSAYGLCMADTESPCGCATSPKVKPLSLESVAHL